MLMLMERRLRVGWSIALAMMTNGCGLILGVDDAHLGDAALAPGADARGDSRTDAPADANVATATFLEDRDNSVYGGGGPLSGLSTPAFTKPFAVGDLIIVAAFAQVGPEITVVDSMGNTYISFASASDPGHDTHLTAFSTHVTTASGVGATVSMKLTPTAEFLGIYAAHYQGVSGEPEDPQVTNAIGATTFSLIVTPKTTPALVWGFAQDVGTCQKSWDVGTGTLRGETWRSTDICACPQDRLHSTGTGAVSWTGIYSTFVAVAGAFGESK